MPSPDTLAIPADDEPMTDEYRQVIREKIAQGVRSLRESRVTDGAAFMTRMDAELVELERQGAMDPNHDHLDALSGESGI